MPPPDPIPGRLRTLQITFAVIVVVALGTAANELYNVSLYNREIDGGDVDWEAGDLRTGMVTVAGLAAYLAGAVTYIRWLLPVYKYLDVVAPGARRFEPYWAIWGWLLPPLWWWRPKQVLNDVLRADGHPPGAVAGAWWELYVASSLISWATIAMADETAEDLRSLSIVYVVTAVLDVAAAVLAVLVARRATRALHRA